MYGQAKDVVRLGLGVGLGLGLGVGVGVGVNPNLNPNPTLNPNQDFMCRSVTLAGGLLLLIWSENDKQRRSGDMGLLQVNPP